MRMLFQLFVIFTAISSLHAQSVDQVVDITRSVADKITRETRFEFTDRVMLDNYHWAHVRIPEIDKRKLFLARATIESEKDTSALLGLAYQGNISIFLNGDEIYYGISDSLKLTEYTYRRFDIQQVLDVDLNKGANQVVIFCRGHQHGLTNIMLMPVDEHDERLTIAGFVPKVMQPFKSTWLISGPYSILASKKELLSMANNLVSGKMDTSTVGKPWVVPSLPVIRELVVDPSNSFQRDSYADWNYANGNTMLGILNLYSVTNDEKYLDFVKHFANHILSNKDYSQWQYENLPALRGCFYRLFRLVMLDDSGGPALPFAELKKTHSVTDYDSILDAVLKHITKRQQRLPDKTLCRPEPENNTIWADDLFMSVPFLCRMGVITQNSKLFDEAAHQIIQFNKYLKNENTGLYFHGWYADRNEPAPFQWGRANGWVTWAMSEALLLIPKKHKDYYKILQIYTDHIQSIVKYQNPRGIWHQILDNPDTYEETSCTAMYTLSLARGVRNGWLNKKYKKNALAGWKAVTSRIGKDGTARGICTGTGIGTSVEFYNARETFDHDPRGLGAILTAGTEIFNLLSMND